MESRIKLLVFLHQAIGKSSVLLLSRQHDRPSLLETSVHVMPKQGNFHERVKNIGSIDACQVAAMVKDGLAEFLDRVKRTALPLHAKQRSLSRKDV